MRLAPSKCKVLLQNVPSVNISLTIARAAFANLRHLWRQNGLSLNLKGRVYQATVRAVLLYGCETWPIRAAEPRRLQVFDNRCLRTIARVDIPSLDSVPRTRLSWVERLSGRRSGYDSPSLFVRLRHKRNYEKRKNDRKFQQHGDSSDSPQADNFSKAEAFMD
ncbi:hypothetical protein T265_02131 [Opisthorchis viverrini]|uniref:Uncharacterized protein n=1 Tax=Opisthorchis viverrini TaxID=6198 RepID=A0A075A024_OPIVI|nr:hypothetical protein T265_02131 [Opisthorchis viverrini]KER31617.1 hypothetical protein T265_02131 [Opisthorchis viverrini]